jgi:hypothetical protein
MGLKSKQVHCPGLSSISEDPLPALASTLLHHMARLGLELISQGIVKETSKIWFASGG